jgi:hypothetical protein
MPAVDSRPGSAGPVGHDGRAGQLAAADPDDEEGDDGEALEEVLDEEPDEEPDDEDPDDEELSLEDEPFDGELLDEAARLSVR